MDLRVAISALILMLAVLGGCKENPPKQLSNSGINTATPTPTAGMEKFGFEKEKPKPKPTEQLKIPFDNQRTRDSARGSWWGG